MSQATNKRGPRWLTVPEVRDAYGDALPQRLKGYLSVALGNHYRSGKVRRRDYKDDSQRVKYQYNASDLRKLFRSKYNVEV